MDFDPKLTFAEQGLRPDQVLRLWSALDRDDPRKPECATDLELLSIEDWRLKWAPNLKYQFATETTTGATVKARAVTQLQVLARQLIRDFGLGDERYKARLGNGTMAHMMRVKSGGDERMAKADEGAASLDKYLRLILKDPYLSIEIGAYQLQRSNKLEWRVNRIVDDGAVGSKQVFATLAPAKERVYELFTQSKTEGLL